VRLSLSLPDEDVEFLDAYAAAQGVESRSAVLQRAVRLLRANELTADYEAAWEEWDSSRNGELWEPVAADGIADAAR